MPYIGEIRMFAGTFAPVGWALCNGALMAIAENDALFNLIGTTYGGDGESTFGLPDLQGRVPVHQGQGAGLSNYQLGEKAGVPSVTLTANQIPVHNHPWLASTDGGTSDLPQDSVLASPPETKVFRKGAPSFALPPTTVAPVGGQQPHENLMPILAVTYIISLYGIYPPPS
jgi:microcystin-dependent protein